MAGKDQTDHTPPSETATEPTPDHVPCRHCGAPISWDQICWVHDATGFADCGLLIDTADRQSFDSPAGTLTIEPALVPTRSPQTYALPVGEWS